MFLGKLKDCQQLHKQHAWQEHTCETVLYTWQACRVGVANPGDLHWCWLHGHYSKPIVGSVPCQLDQHLYPILPDLHTISMTML